MPGYRDGRSFFTVEAALKTTLTVSDLARLARRLSPSPLPKRKADLVALVLRYLEDPGLRVLWERLDELERAAVSEAVHALGGRLQPNRFRAKYGRDPCWAPMDRRARADERRCLACSSTGPGSCLRT